MENREIMIVYLMKMIERAKEWNTNSNPFGMPRQIVIGVLTEAMKLAKEAMENERKTEPEGGSQTD